MSYITGEARILDLIQGMNSGKTWTDKNSISLTNDADLYGQKMVNSGASYHYLMLDQGPFTEDWWNPSQMDVVAQWQTVIGLTVIEEPNRSVSVTLAKDIEDLRTTLNKYGRLNKLTGVVNAKITSGGRRYTSVLRIGQKSLTLFKVDLTLAWTEITHAGQLG
jgi:hypothetical protein